MGSKHQAYAEAIVRIKSRGWRVDEERGGYPMAFCPCGRHKKAIKMTPSNPHYWKNLEAWFNRTHCSPEEGS